MFNFETLLRLIAVVVVASAVQMLVRTTLNSLVQRLVKGDKDSSPTEEKKREETLLHVFRPLSRVLIWLTALIIALSILGVNVAALVTGAGALGLVFGVVAQSAFKDYIAGIYIIIENQYRVGDVVMLAGTTSGVVEDITIRVTRLRDMDGNVHFVRNGDTGVITNMTVQYSNVNIDLQVGYDTDVDKVEKIINEVGEAMSTSEAWRDAIVEPIKFLRVDSFGESTITIKALGQVLPMKQWDVAGGFRRQIIAAFDAHGIERPYPQRVVHTLTHTHISKKGSKL